jgi:ubiquinone/menaquinone biosynthesis C-methylase UbiE
MRSARLVAGFAALALVFGPGCTRVKRFAYEGFGRDGWQQPEEVIRSLGIDTGDRVADLGAGGGYFTFRLADAVGLEGRVYAVDVDEGMTEYLRKEAAERDYSNVAVVLAEYHDPLLPEAGVDLIFTCNTYHHMQDRTAYFNRVKRALRPEGRVAIVEYNGEGWFQKLFSHSTPNAVIRSEMEAAGYRLVQDHEFLSRQNFLVFAARPS